MKSELRTWYVVWAITILMIIGVGLLIVFEPDVVAPVVSGCLACVAPLITLPSSVPIPRASRSRFDRAVRFLSKASLTGTLLTLIVFLGSFRGRGIEFFVHISLFLMLAAQIAVLAGGITVAAVVGAFRRELRLAWPAAVLLLIAVAGLAGQYFALRHVRVDSSSIP